ncbi:hypothetical protein ACQPUY_07950 [Clostridium nigeriense]|uniref:hypothetical protein n=1 Tax=Clostridium nigeriense TaxID=1805470 RepID=UPI003D327ECD
MSNWKNFVIAFLLSVAIVIGFLILFEIIGFQQQDMGIVLVTIIVFTMILCTYAIIDEIRKIKDTK